MTEQQFPDDQLKVLKTRRGQIKSRLTRFQNYLSSTFQSNKNLTELSKRLSVIEPHCFNDFDAVQSEIEVIDPNEASERDNFEIVYFACISAAQDYINDSKVNQTHSQIDSFSRGEFAINSLHTQPIRVNLPLINLPHFKGSYNEYTHFHDTFVSLIDNNESLDEVQKFHYLISCLEGEAVNLVQSLDITASNYRVAWDLLKQRYENKRMIINSHLKSLFDLPVLPKENVTSLRHFIDSFNKDLRALKSLGQDIDQWDTILLFLLSSKLDFASKKDWENKISSNSNPTVSEFCKFLNNRCQVLESLYHKDNNTSQGQKQSFQRGSGAISRNHVSTRMEQSKEFKCFYCQGAHCLYYCDKFLKLNGQDRCVEVKKLKLCVNCLKPFSYSHSCNGSCKVCKAKHNTLLHISRGDSYGKAHVSSPETQEEVPGRQNETKGNFQISQDTELAQNLNTLNVTAHSNNVDNSMVLLATANILIKNESQQYVSCRALLDGGSQSNFITSELVQKLNLQTEKVKFPISGIGESITNVSTKVSTSIKSHNSSFTKNMSFLVLDNITGYIPSQSFDCSKIVIPNGLVLADDKYNRSQRVDILIGASVFYELLSPGQIKLGKNLPILQSTKLGWLVTGSVFSNKFQGECCMLSMNQDELSAKLEKFWSLEEVQLSNVKLTKEEQFCEDHFKENFKRDETGRFTVSLPLKDNVTELGNTYENAKRRFLHLEQKMQKNIAFAKMYREFMHEYEDLNHMTRLAETDVSAETIHFYLPHHGVLKESSETTKLRVVFDASAKGTTGISLNDVACVGPTIQEDLISIILRFRIHNYVIKADIAKMYRQVNVKKEHRDLQRILWRDDPDEELSHFVLNTVTYGTAPASFLAIRSLRQAAIEQAEVFPEAANIIFSDFYVDDLISGSCSIENLRRLKCEVFDILQGAGFVLRQWKSNNRDVLDTDEYQDSCHFSEEGSVKTLGIMWNPNSDCFHFSIDQLRLNRELTKRVVLSLISQIFDPLGIIGPIIIKAKIILQQLWRMKSDWDDPIPASHRSEFMQFFESLNDLNKISVPRQVCLSVYINIQLHGFTDASEQAYGVCIYIRTEDSVGRISSMLLCSKSRVAPLKCISLPRLELCGAVLLSKLVDKTTKSLKIQFNEICLWTDSMIVLAWLAQEPTSWKTFVSNRVSEIQGLTNSATWSHVISEENPADIISRGCSVTTLADCALWWSGPHWLQQVRCHWPKVAPISIHTDDALEKRSNKLVCISTVSELCFIDKFSSYSKLLRVTAYCLRFIANLKTKQTQKTTGGLQTEEIIQARCQLIRLIQAKHFSMELVKLKQKGQVSKKSRLLSLNPFLDDHGIIRVGGRLTNARLSVDKRYPIVLPNKCHFTDLVILYEHLRTLHGGVQTVLSAVRQMYWPIGSKSQVKKIVYKCITCFRARPKQFCPTMGNLPKARVTPSSPFYISGCDYAGPFFIRDGTVRGRKIVKVYVCVFICFSTKAIHLELAGDLSTKTFLNALKRFFSRRGICKEIWSDNGTNFQGASNTLENLKTHLMSINDDNEFQDYLLKNQVKWHFIPPRAPHFGGLWESAVRLMKHHLTRVIGDAHLTYEHFNTLLIQVEAVLNSRPLSPISNDPNDLNPLTPGHFLIGRELTSLPEELIRHIPTNRLNLYQRVQQMMQSFWQRWQRDYLHTLHQRTKWMFKPPNSLQAGQMVLLKEDNLIPMRWKLGRIVKTYKGNDDITRVVDVQTTSGVVKRAFSKICVLPIDGCVEGSHT